MRFWRTGTKSSPPAGDRSARARLEAIDESTPHRYRFRLAEADDRDAAVAVLRDPRRVPLTFEVADEQDGRVRFDVAAAGNGRPQSIISVLYSLQRADVAVDGFDALDVIEDLDEADLVKVVETWRKVANNGPTRSRIERLGGSRLLEMSLGRYLESPKTQRPYGFAVQEIAFNTPGCENRLDRGCGWTRRATEGSRRLRLRRRESSVLGPRTVRAVVLRRDPDRLPGGAAARDGG